MPENIPDLLRLLTILVMGFTSLAAFGIGVLFFFKQSGLTAANQIYGTLLLSCGGMQLHFLLAFAGLLDDFATLKFLPIYFSLSIPVLFFYYVKMTLYPGYRPKRTDIKHFILPLGQILYMFGIWLIPDHVRQRVATFTIHFTVDWNKHFLLAFSPSTSCSLTSIFGDGASN
jgi:hypothetical protein